MPRHKEVQVKVNALVDEGVAELVRALSDIPGLITLESCQGGNDADAYVYFRMMDWRQIGEFLFDRLLPALTDDQRSCVSLRVQAYDALMARGSITLDPRALASVAESVRRLSSVRPRALMARDAHREAVA